MSFLSGYFSALVLCFSIFIFTHVSNGFDNNVAHDLKLESRDDFLPQQDLFVMQQDENRNIGSMPLDGRSLIDSWLGRRQACAIAGDSPCPSQYFLPPVTHCFSNFDKPATNVVVQGTPAAHSYVASPEKSVALPLSTAQKKGGNAVVHEESVLQVGIVVD
ncbi:hypothetical protein HYFRA_00001716 [Hymenoscyphus fraxineus]|uniref:Uncharacterized protein n=1 Tax=Hymenoscyphus fraxineus TaxID=746836 RepID=A0A9N9L834_9HELO|nr:hypothetical protein HYFRA_00001716 [Hymenoscyphus fraxineus]